MMINTYKSSAELSRRRVFNWQLVLTLGLYFGMVYGVAYACGWRW